ncbi:MAG: 1-(5-phosphoribosyl)-5-[(5-phosphoribosylamino)methylideneamino]imidazole-4-carboxamide isomerase [Planctomycetota bacterium]|jgi:phosphoribosylformimino-5-aminoimidazole carboxamide ribotide isomerase
MYIIPAIDLIKGRCVRLIQGDYHREIVYEDDPVKKAGEFVSAGAQWLHIIDLEGAKVGKPVNTESVMAIAALKLLKIELGGGIRDEDSIKQMLELGVERVIVGTKAVNDFEWFSRMAEKFTGKIVLGLDARGSTVATNGWTQESHKLLVDFAAEAAKLPLAAIIYTDIAEAADIPVIASGGVKDINDVERLAELGVEAVVVGRSLYEGTLNLADAVKAVS